MSVQYYYNYAEIDLETNMCVGVISCTYEVVDDPCWVAIPVCDEEYMLKYYINGAWYEDAEATIPWQSSLI